MDDWKEQYSDDPEVVIGWIKSAYMMSDGDWCDCVRRVAAARDKEINSLRAELAGCRALLRRCLPIIESDAQMMADLSRFAPLDPVAQATHDATEYDSERLVREIPAALAKDDAARKGEETQ